MHTVTRPVLILCGLLGACTLPTAVTTTWQGTFNTAHVRDAIEGNVAVVSTDRLDAGIQIHNAPGTVKLTWMLRSGSCDQPGGIVAGRGVYPTLTTDSLGSASGETVADATLKADGHYQASVLDSTDAVLACTALQRQ